jgi:signal transduction histidine kinase
MTRALLELTSTTVHEEWKSAVRRVVQFDAQTLHVERVSFWSLADETSSLRCEAGYIVTSHSFERGAVLFEFDHQEYFDAIRERGVLDIPDVASDARTATLRNYASIRGITSMLDVPVVVEGKLEGVLCHEHVGTRRRWLPAEKDFAEGAGRVLATALAERSLTLAGTTARRAAFLDSVSRVVLPSLDMHDIASAVLGLVVPRFAEMALVWRLAPDGQLEPLASTHADVRQRDLVAQGAREASGTVARSPGLNYVITEGQSLLYPELHPAVFEKLNEAQQRRLRHLRIRSVTSVPLTAGGKTFGVMSWGAVSRNYTADDMSLAEAVAERLAAALENARLYAVAQQAIHARDEFLVLAAHELRTPLTALELFVHAAQSGGVPQGTTDENVRRVVRQVRRLSSLVERLWDAANIRAAGVALAPESCDLAAIVRERADAALARTRAGQSIAVRTPPSLRGRWDRTRVSQLLDELLQNAIKFGEGKPIEVALDRVGADALLTVRDHGVGIPSERLESVFAPFERVSRSDPPGGLGLGLHVAKAIVEAHGGSIEAVSTPSLGTTLRARLPIEVESVRVVVNHAP